MYLMYLRACQMTSVGRGLFESGYDVWDTQSKHIRADITVETTRGPAVSKKQHLQEILPWA